MSAHSRRLPWYLWVALLAAAALPLATLAAPTATPPKPMAKPAIKPAGGGPAPANPAVATPAPKPAATRAPAARPSNDVALDAIAAMVNDEPVLASDVEEQLFLFLQRSQAHPDSAQVDTLRHQVLDQLIDDKILLAEAKRQSITVNPAEVARQVEGAIGEAKQRLGGDEGFQQQLQRENTTEERLRERYKVDVERQMTEQRLVAKMFPKKTVSQAEAEAYYLAHRDKFPKVPPQLRLQVIQIMPAPDSATLLRTRARADSLRRRIVNGEKFAKVAAEASDDPGSANSGGDLGFFRHGRIEPEIEEAAFALANGGLSQPVRTVFGWHLVQPIERDTVRSPAGKDSLDADGTPIVEVHARHILVKVTPNDADVERALELAKKVHEQAAKGGDFAALVKRYSAYPGKTGPDGDVGFLSLAQMQPNIRAGLQDLKIGEVSDILPNTQGLNIFKLNDRKPEREYAVSEIKEELPEAVAQAQNHDKYDVWLKGLRAKAQIEYRDL